METNAPEEKWDQNQPPLWQWVLLAAIGLIALGGFIATMVFGYQKFSSFTEDRRQTATVEAAAQSATLTAVVHKRTEAIEQAKNLHILIQDSFENNQNEWLVGEIDDEYSKISVTIDGSYLWDATAKQGFVWRVWPRWEDVDDFYLAVEAQNRSQNKDAQYGLIFHSNEDAYIFLEVRDSGYYHLMSYDGEMWQDLIPSTFSALISQGEPNLLAVASVESVYYILINDIYVDETPGTSLSTGQAGVAIGLSNEDEQAVIAFDNFELRALYQDK